MKQQVELQQRAFGWVLIQDGCVIARPFSGYEDAEQWAIVNNFEITKVNGKEI